MANSKDLTVDGELVRALASLLQETGLTEIEYAVGERRIRVVRGAPAAAVTLAVPAVAAAPPPGPIIAPDLPRPPKSPLVRPPHLSPPPGGPPFIQAGATLPRAPPLPLIP